MWQVINAVDGDIMSNWSSEVWARQEMDRLEAFGYHVDLAKTDWMPLDDDCADFEIDEPFVL